MASVAIRDVHKAFGQTRVIHGVSVEIADGEFVILVGPSGCGKSTLLRMLAGLENITAGEIRIGDRVVNNVPPKERDIAMVFQNYALYPHMTVADNMAFSMKLRKAPKSEIQARVAKAAGILGLGALLDRYPRQLSGGQRQRVAMGRAIVRDPQVFLFDEPLSNLDAKLRVAMRTEIKELHQRLRTTTVYVTHDQIEAMTMADRIVVMHDGIVEQAGAPLELYDRPANQFVAGFIGSPSMNFISGRVQSNGSAGFASEGGLVLPVGRAPGRLGGAAAGARNPAGAFRRRIRRGAGRGVRGGADRLRDPARRQGRRPGIHLRLSGSYSAEAGRDDPHQAGLGTRPLFRCRIGPTHRRLTSTPKRPGPRPDRKRGAKPPPSSFRQGDHAMTGHDRRSILKGAAALGLAGSADLAAFAKAWAQDAQWKPEAGASLSLLRWKRFVPSEDEAFMKLVDAFTKATGVNVTVTNESFDDIQPKASVAANTGQGPDMVWGLYSFPALFPDKCLEVGDVADYLGKKYGPWVPAAEAYGKIKGKWIAIPVAFNGGYINYRIAAVKKAGFDKVPADTAGFLELCKGLKKNNTPAGFALGHSTGDANSWCHWALWTHGGNLVDANEKIVINSPETAKALEYVKALYETFIPGTASWNDSSNNKAFLAGELYLTANGISIYAAAKQDNKKIAEDMDHALFPVGPVGKPTEFQLAFPILAYKYTKVPECLQSVHGLHDGRQELQSMA